MLLEFEVSQPSCLGLSLSWHGLHCVYTRASGSSFLRVCHLIFGRFVVSSCLELLVWADFLWAVNLDMHEFPPGDTSAFWRFSIFFRSEAHD